MSLPISYTWTLPTTVPPPVVSVVPSFPAGTGSAVCDGVFYDTSYFLTMFDRRLPLDYLAPLKLQEGAGYELFQQNAEVFSRVSRAIERLECGCIIMYSQGGSYAETTVEFSRPSAAGGAVRIGAGTIVSCSATGRRFATQTDVDFGALELGPKAVLVKALAPTWQYNVLGKEITPVSAIVLEGEIDTILTIIQINLATGQKDYLDGSIVVTNVLPASGGQVPLLDGLGLDRGIIRNENEPDDRYRYRVRILPDNLTPAAIRRALTALFDQYGVTYQFIETFDLNYQTCWDFPSPNAGTPTYMNPYPSELNAWKDVFTFDDPRDPTPFMNRWLDVVEDRATFIVVVPHLQPIQDFGGPYDDTAMDAGDRQTLQGSVAGSWALMVYDAPIGVLPAADGPVAPYDSFDAGIQGFYGTVWQLLQELKAAGVVAVLEQQGN